MGSWLLFFLNVSLFTFAYSGSISSEYSADYNDENYDNKFEDDATEHMKEDANDRTPKLLSVGRTLIVSEGDAIKLPCLVDNLESLLIIWKRGSTIIALGDKPYEDDDSRVEVQKELNGNSLVIRFSEQKDAGDYVCQVSSTTPVELTHTVKIIVQPEVEPVPQSGLVTVKAGEPAEIGCKVTRGDPEPEINWKRKDKLMPNGAESLMSQSITFPKTSRQDSGLYTCYADNRWGSPAEAKVHLDVQHGPEIEQEVMNVDTEGREEVRIICIVHASPEAQVTWYKNQKLMSTKDNVISKRGNRHTLLLTALSEEDRQSEFECKAKNELGEDSSIITINSDTHSDNNKDGSDAVIASKEISVENQTQSLPKELEMSAHNEKKKKIAVEKEIKVPDDKEIKVPLDKEVKVPVDKDTKVPGENESEESGLGINNSDSEHRVKKIPAEISDKNQSNKSTKDASIPEKLQDPSSSVSIMLDKPLRVFLAIFSASFVL